MSARDAILTEIRKTPAIHFRELQQKTHLAVGQVQHHLRALIDEGMIDDASLLGHKHYYVNDVPKNNRVLIALLRHPVCRKIIIHLSAHAGLHCAGLSEHLQLSPSTVSWYVSRLTNAGIIEVVQHGSKRCIHMKEEMRVQADHETKVS